MIRPLNIVLGVFALGVGVSLFTACGSASLSSFSTPGTAPADYGVSVNSFRETVWPILRTNCMACHGAKQSPLFALEDELKSHNNLIDAQKVNFQAPEQSRLVKQLQNHHNCWSNCTNDANKMRDAIMEWIAKRGVSDADQVAPITLTTADLPVPSPLPFYVLTPGIGNNPPTAPPSSAAAILEFDVSKLTGILNAKLTFEMFQWDDYSYALRKPTLIAGVPIKVKTMSVLINGINLPVNGTWRTLDTIVPATISATLAAPFGGNEMILESQNGIGKDTISIGFEELTPQQ